MALTFFHFILFQVLFGAENEYFYLIWKHCISGGAVKAHGVSPVAPASYLSAESANKMQFGNSSFDNHGFAAKMAKDRSMEVFNAMPSGDHSSGKNIAGKAIDTGGSSSVTNANMVLHS